MKLSECKRITSFVPYIEDGKLDKHRQLRQLFSGCVAHNVPFGSYRVRGDSEMLQFEGYCEVDQERPVCIPVINWDAFRPDTHIYFRLDNIAGMKQPVWLNVQPVFDWTIRGRIQPSVVSVTVAFDENGLAHLGTVLLSNFCVTLMAGGSVISSTYVKAVFGTANFYRLFVTDQQLRAEPLQACSGTAAKNVPDCPWAAR